MILLTIVVLAAAALVSLSCYLRQQSGRRLRRLILMIGLSLGLARAALASLGWYVVEHTGGPLQVPAFALAMLAWPEAAVFADRRVSPAPPNFYLGLSLLLVTSTLAIVAVVGIASRRAWT